MPKDGPSAGVTMVTALTSMATGRPVRSEVGMTGEVTLNGRVLPIGGVKQKLLAAQRAGLTTVFLPKRNEPDLDDVPAEVLEAIDVRPITDVAEIVARRSSRPCRSLDGSRRRLSVPIERRMPTPRVLLHSRSRHSGDGRAREPDPDRGQLSLACSVAGSSLVVRRSSSYLLLTRLATVVMTRVTMMTESETQMGISPSQGAQSARW